MRTILAGQRVLFNVGTFQGRECSKEEAQAVVEAARAEVRRLDKAMLTDDSLSAYKAACAADNTLSRLVAEFEDAFNKVTFREEPT